MLDIIGIDQPCLDHMVLIDHIPAADTQLMMERQCWQGGGRVPTALVAAARLGAKTGLMGRTGGDRIGHFLYRELEGEGVDVSRLQMQADRRSDYVVALAEQATHGRSFIANPGTFDPYGPEDVSENFVKSARGILLYRFDAADIRAAELAREAGATVACDCDADEYMEDLMANIGLIDVFIASEFAYNMLFPQGGDMEENCRTIWRMGPSTVIFTLGSQGCAGLEEDGSFFRLNAFSVPVVDTTGAGDTFHGAYLYASLCENMGIKASAEFASAVSAIQCMFLGGRSGLPERSMVEDFLTGRTFDRRPLEAREARYSDFPV